MEKVNDHLANERTFLAWIRTSIGIMVFGFVVVKFSFFLKQFSALLGKSATPPHPGFSAVVGVVLVALGMLASICGYIRYKQTERQINETYFKSSSLLIGVLTAFICVISLILIIYLVIST